MRRFLTALVLASVLVTTFPAAYAQRAAEKPKSKKAAVSITAQRGVDTIAAAQLMQRWKTAGGDTDPQARSSAA